MASPRPLSYASLYTFPILFIKCLKFGLLSQKVHNICTCWKCIHMEKILMHENWMGWDAVVEHLPRVCKARGLNPQHHANGKTAACMHAVWIHKKPVQHRKGYQVCQGYGAWYLDCLFLLPRCTGWRHTLGWGPWLLLINPGIRLYLREHFYNVLLINPGITIGQTITAAYDNRQSARVGTKNPSLMISHDILQMREYIGDTKALKV